jgi:hypothetical protein
MKRRVNECYTHPIGAPSGDSVASEPHVLLWTSQRASAACSVCGGLRTIPHSMFLQSMQCDLLGKMLHFCAIAITRTAASCSAALSPVQQQPVASTPRRVLPARPRPSPARWTTTSSHDSTLLVSRQYVLFVLKGVGMRCTRQVSLGLLRTPSVATLT